MKNVAFLTQRVDYIIKLCLELIGFQLFPEVKPTAEKAVTVCIHVCPEVADQSGLHGNLRALAEGIFVLCLDHCSLLIFNHLYVPLTFPNFIRGYLIDTPTAKAETLRLSFAKWANLPTSILALYLHCFPVLCTSRRKHLQM